MITTILALVVAYLLVRSVFMDRLVNEHYDGYRLDKQWMDEYIGYLIFKGVINRNDFVNFQKNRRELMLKKQKEEESHG